MVVSQHVSSLSVSIFIIVFSRSDSSYLIAAAFSAAAFSAAAFSAAAFSDSKNPPPNITLFPCASCASYRTYNTSLFPFCPDAFSYPLSYCNYAVYNPDMPMLS